MGSIFGIAESTNFAKSLAANEGIKVLQVRENVTPYSREDGSIVIGVPSLYNNDEYMGHLHREIGKQMKDMSFFYTLKEEESELRKAAKMVLQAQRTEYNKAGEFRGRDRILANQYRADMERAGGVSRVVEELATVNPTIAAMVYIGNEIRNEWQGYNPCDMPQSIQLEVERLRPVLESKWLQIDSKEDLEEVLNSIQYKERDDDRGEGNSDGSGDSSGDGGGSERSGSGDGEREPGTEETEGSGSSSPEESSGTGEDSSGDEGVNQNPQEGGEGEGDDAQGGGEEGGRDSEEAQGEGRGEQRSESEGGTADGQSPEGEGDSQGDGGEGTESEGQGGGTAADSKDSASDGGDGDDTKLAHNEHGASDAASRLADIGLIKEPAYQATPPEKSDSVPYVPDDRCSIIDLTKRELVPSRRCGIIEKKLEGFILSKRIRKYLITMSQTGYEYGKKRGKLCSKSISRIYAGHTQPRIFKQKNAQKIQQDTAIFILGDCSGSMSRSRYDISSACQISMSECLQSLRIPHMMMQFTTKSKRVHYIMKRFEEQFVSRDTLIARYSHGGIYMGSNADGEAVTEAAQRLAARPEKNKILLVLSDGAPAWDYGDERFLKDTVKHIEESKVMHILGIGIESSRVEEYYSDCRVIYKLEEMESVLLNMLRDKVLK